MFTGLVETIGILKSRNVTGDAGVLKIAPLQPFTDLKFGESIAVNGTCLTLSSTGSNSDTVLSFNVLAESFLRTNLGSIKIGGKVNLERALAVGDRLGGHIVQGHVDGVCKVIEWKDSGRDKILRVGYPENLKSFFIQKGSVALDGVSLTIVELTDEFLSVHLIPTTLEETCLGDKKPGDKINIETDVIGKYVCRLLENSNRSYSNISIDTLSKAGW